jgi:tRNA(fMet)-specific endonuclease VapC
MHYGLTRLPEGRRKQVLTLYLEQVLTQPLTIFSYDREAAIWHAEERVRLTSQGRTPSYVDSQIAAIARVHNLILVTRNTDEFADFVDLTVENWFESSQ